jgi:Replication-relaxation
MVPVKNTKNDLELIKLLGEFKMLTISQLALLSQRSRQVIRRRIRFLINQGVILARERSYGNRRGRPEDLIFLTETGWDFFLAECGPMERKSVPVGKSLNSMFIEHDLLVNWFLVHLIQIEREIPQLSVNFLIQDLALINDSGAGEVQIPERELTRNSEKEFLEFIPDCVFTITNAEIKKSLLFFLEVDMGTETIVSPKRDLKDIRQKIVNHQALFRTGQYKRYEKILKVDVNGFRLLFLVNSPARQKALCRLVREMPPSDFIWLTDQDSMFSHGLPANIWARGGRLNNPPQSILGRNLASEITVMDKIR